MHVHSHMKVCVASLYGAEVQRGHCVVRVQHACCVWRYSIGVCEVQ